ncbi:hypothetical protein ACVWZK_008574 [Bradyrhizobium sp. GM0.4]
MKAARVGDQVIAWLEQWGLASCSMADRIKPSNSGNWSQKIGNSDHLSGKTRLQEPDRIAE